MKQEEQRIWFPIPSTHPMAKIQKFFIMPCTDYGDMGLTYMRDDSRNTDSGFNRLEMGWAPRC